MGGEPYWQADGEEHLLVPDDGVHVKDVARHEALQHVKGLAIPQFFQDWPELVGVVDLADAHGGRLRSGV